MAVGNLKLMLFFLVCLVVPSTLANPVTPCNKKAKYAVKVNGIKMSPDPVKPGKEAVFTISASSGQAIAGGKMIIDVAFFGVHVHSETQDLCEKTSCPVPAGDFELSHSQTLPSFTPPGSYTLKMRMQNSNNQLLTCINFPFKIGFGASVSDS